MEDEQGSRSLLEDCHPTAILQHLGLSPLSASAEVQGSDPKQHEAVAVAVVEQAKDPKQHFPRLHSLPADLVESVAAPDSKSVRDSAPGSALDSKLAQPLADQDQRKQKVPHPQLVIQEQGPHPRAPHQADYVARSHIAPSTSHSQNPQTQKL